MNTEITYNINDNLRNLTITMSHDITALAKNFDAFIAEWSGLNTLLKTAQSNYNLSTAPILSEMDKKVWIYEHFMGDSRFSSDIESRINTTASAMKTSSSPTVRQEPSTMTMTPNTSQYISVMPAQKSVQSI